MKEQIIQDMIYEKAWNTHLTDSYKDFLGTIDNFKKTIKLIECSYSSDYITYKINHGYGYWSGVIKVDDVQLAIRNERWKKLKELGI
jgi:hypothetical protein